MTLDLKPLDHCPVCSEKEKKALFPIPGSHVFQCTQCGLRYLDPCLSPKAMASAYESGESLVQFHGFHANYYDYGDLEVESGTKKEFTRGLQKLESVLPQGSTKNILDVGYGNGFFLALARQGGWNVEGIDTSEHNREVSRKKFSLDLRTGDFEKDIPDAEYYDSVTFWDVLEHFSDPHPILRKTHRILKPAGLVLAAVPNDKSLLFYLSSCLYRLSLGRFRMGIEQVYFQEHVCYYSLRPMQELFRRNGFELVDHFFSSTDLEKYTLLSHRKLIAKAILLLGRSLRLENRLVAIFKKVPHPAR